MQNNYLTFLITANYNQKSIFLNIKKILNFKYNFVHLYCSIILMEQIYEHCSFFKTKTNILFIFFYK
ncbi:hypothetical protein HNP24_001898 [Chryseobacterium sediminis]|uniref:Uncharacterized protein n=1 Tax=Chryseobacterium sediminis TaxID=1679494 RepID=A0ABR6Q1F8_9FLAO|nr:hypothetical protein [Chryseobacterium sediminis]